MATHALVRFRPRSETSGALALRRPTAGRSVLDRIHEHTERAARQRAVSGAEAAGEPLITDRWGEHLATLGVGLATSYASGVVIGYRGKDGMKIAGVPVDLPLGAMLFGLSFFESKIGRKKAIAMRGVGMGLVFGHGGTWGKGTGKLLRAKRNLPPLIEGETAPRTPKTGGASLSDEEIASIARRQ